MSDMKPVFKWEGDPQYEAGVITLWPDTHREMRLPLPDFRTAHALGMAINGVTKEAFVRGRESMKADVLNIPNNKRAP